MKRVLGLIAIVAILIGYAAYRVIPGAKVLVKPGYRAVKTSWGKIVPKSYEPGLVWKIPYTEDYGNDIMLVDVKPQRFSYNFDFNTRDLQRLSFECSIVCNLKADSVHRLIDQYPGGLSDYETTVIGDLVNSTLRVLIGKTDIWMFVSEGQDKMITDAAEYIVNDNLVSQNLVQISALRNLGYTASEEFEKMVEQTVQAKQGEKLEEAKAAMAKKATDRVREEALQTYERLAAVARANGVEIEIKAKALMNNPFVAQYEVAKALQNWKGELQLPQVLTIMDEASKGGSDVFKFFPIPTKPVK